jgi:hypothetical protein
LNQIPSFCFGKRFELYFEFKLWFNFENLLGFEFKILLIQFHLQQPKFINKFPIPFPIFRQTRLCGPLHFLFVFSYSKPALSAYLSTACPILFFSPFSCRPPRQPAPKLGLISHLAHWPRLSLASGSHTHPLPPDKAPPSVMHRLAVSLVTTVPPSYAPS